MLGRLLVLVLCAFVVVPQGADAAAKKRKKKPRAVPALTVEVLSGRADLVSGGDALVRIGGVASTDGLKVTAAGKDVTKAFTAAGGRVTGLVEGLPLGASTIVAKAPKRTGARLKVKNHPIGGPVFAGPQIQPWACQPGAKDAQCNADAEVTFQYVDGNGQFQPYDPKDPPASGQVATTRTDTGQTVPFIVRKEVGYLDRDQYAIAALVDPAKPVTGTAPQPQLNRRLVLTHGASCDTEYTTAEAPDVMNQTFLGHGFVVASHALNNAGHNCNLVTQAESLVMTKEAVIERFGPLRWTIGSGCSGGSLVQQQVANAYPGVYQAITPQCSFTDAWSSAMQYVDYVGLLRYFQDPSRWDPGTVWSPEKIAAVLDHPNISNPVTFTTVIPNSSDPSRACSGVPADQVYDPQTNPGGVKCTLQDYMVNVFGKRPDGFANRAFGNTNVQYGLDGLRDGTLSPADFVDLNTNGGGINHQGDVDPQRSAPDLVGTERAYRSGAVNSANYLDQVAIIDLRGPDPGAFHDVYRTYALRARLLRNFGTAANQVLWRGQVPLLGDTSFADDAVLAADKWLARVDADDRDVPLARKIIENKPGDVTHRCTNGAGQALPKTVCDTTVASYGTPRLGADMPATDDVLVCQTKPLRRDDYPVTFTDAQWSRLQAVFPDGVCDYAKPGVGQTGAVPWLTYQEDDGDVVYGGRPLGDAPRSAPLKTKKAKKKRKRR